MIKAQLTCLIAVAALAAQVSCSSPINERAPEPLISAIAPSIGTSGTLVTVTGERFEDTQGVLYLNAVPVGAQDIVSWTSNEVKFWVPSAASTGEVRIAVLSGTSNGLTFTVSGPDPTPALRADIDYQGALTGKHAVISPGHGYYYSTATGTWTTQRGDQWGLIEDRHTNEIAIDFLIPMLERAGCDVVSCRERTKQSCCVILNDEVGSPSYSETGTGWATTTSTGLGYYGSDYRYCTVSPAETAAATWRPEIPVAGIYPVYLWLLDNSNRATDALYLVTHKGGVTEVRVDQQRYGSRWQYIGEWWFDAGTAGSVTLSNESAQAGQVVIADAVRFGGGTGIVVRPSGTSGRPMWQECCRIWLETLGVPANLYEWGSEDNLEDVTARANFADWMQDSWGTDAGVYLSIHTNAAATPNTGTGTDTFIHDTAPSPGSADFQDVLHPIVVDDIRALWKSDWADRGQQTANFGEVRETNDMPALLIELAFHDTETPDNDFLHEDEFRRDVARALYKGISKYLNPSGAIAPLPPTHLRVESAGRGAMRVCWRARNDPRETTAAPTGYVVYSSTDGKAFDNGRHVTGATSATITRLLPGQVTYFRVSATNSGGESLPTEVLCGRVADAQSPRVLIVNGFDRLDRYVTFRDSGNSFDYVTQHASSIAAAGAHVFDSASNEAVADGDVALAAYGMVDWILGEESTADETFSDDEQALAAAYVNAGGSMLVTGAEVAWDLGEKGSSSDAAFLSGTLGASYRLDTPGTGVRSVEPSSGSIFAGMPSFSFDDGTHGTYDVDWPDVFNPAGSSVACLVYSGGLGYAAGIQCDFTGGGKVVLFGFPLETVYSEQSRNELVSRILSFLLD